MERTTSLPQFQDWSIAAVRLLQGAVYSDDSAAWDTILSSRTRLEEYFGRLGLMLVLDEPEGFAFLRQAKDDEQPEGYDRLPKLFRKTRLSYGATLLTVILRDELRHFEEEDIENERCVVSTADLFARWKMFFGPGDDEVRLHKGLDTALRTIDDLKFIRRFSVEPEEWEIRRILKARLPVSELEELHERLSEAVREQTEHATARGSK